MMDCVSGYTDKRYYRANDLGGFRPLLSRSLSNAHARPRVGCREERPPQRASLPCWRVWMCLCVKTLARVLVRTTKIASQTGQTSRRKWNDMPWAVCGRVHRTSLPTPTTKPSQNALQQATLPGPETTPPLHAIALAFVVKLHSMLSLWWSWLMVAASSEASSSACCV